MSDLRVNVKVRTFTKTVMVKNKSINDATDYTTQDALKILGDEVSYFISQQGQKTNASIQWLQSSAVGSADQVYITYSAIVTTY